MKDCIVVNIEDMMEAIGEDEVSQILSDFSCKRNKEIEDFVRNKAIDFAKRKLSITYLVLQNVSTGIILVGIFTLTHKAIEITNADISSTTRRKLKRFAELDEDTNRYNASAFLIAQLGKNDDLPQECKVTVTGNDLMDATFEILAYVQHYVGGGIVYLECENIQNLLNFYQNDHNQFKIFGKRTSIADNKNYIQLLKFF